MTIEKIFGAILSDAEAKSETKLICRRIFPDKSREVYVGVSGADRKKMLFIVLQRKDIPALPDFESTRGLEVALDSRLTGNGDKVALLVALKDELYSDFFMALIEDITAQIRNVKSDKAAAAKCVSRLTSWANFLKRAFSTLSEDARLGLFAELSFLLQHLNSLGGKGVAAWKGPYGADQDFQFNDLGVEIKSSREHSRDKVVISNEFQLCTDNFSKLFLCHYVISESDSRGVSIPELVTEIIARLGADTAAISCFTDALMELGYHNTNANLFSTPKYAIRKETVYRITSKFPKLTPKDLPSGITNTRYSLSMESCAKYRISNSDFLKGAKE